MLNQITFHGFDSKGKGTHVKIFSAYFQVHCLCVLFFAVYILWQFPDLLSTFCTWPEVFTKLVGGAGKNIMS